MASIPINTKLLLAGLAIGLALLVKWPTTLSSWLSLACWPLGALLFSYIARIYIAPNILMRFSSHIRVRSVSLRSIRGLYFRSGGRTLQIDRFVYSYRSSTESGPRGLSFRVEGLKLEIQPPPSPPPRPIHRRGLTLADLSPSPLALYLWSVVSRAYVIFDPAVRPLIRLVVTAGLQQVIRFIPRLTETVQVDVDRAVVLYAATPQICLTVENITFKAHVSFAQGVQFRPIRERSAPRHQTLTATALAMGAWKSRLAKGFQRTWTRTWNNTLGQMTGSVAYDLVVQQLRAFIPATGPLPIEDGMILRSPEPFEINGSARFSPRDGTVEPGSVHNQVRFEAIYVDADTLLVWLSHFKAADEYVPAPFPSSTNSLLSSTASPWLKSPFSATSAVLGTRFNVSPKPRKKSFKPLDFIAAARFDLGSITAVKSIGGYKYSLVLRTLSGSCEPSDATKNPTYCTWLGKQPPSSSNPFSFGLNFQDISFRRLDDRLTSPILKLGHMSVDLTISDWPSILPTIPALSCDVNLPSVLLVLHMASIELIDRQDLLLTLVSDLNSKNPKDIPYAESEPFLPHILSPIPKFVVNLSVGRILARLICADLPGTEDPFSLELETEGLIFTSSTEIRMGVAVAPHHLADGHLPFHMTCPFSFILHPLFLRLRTHCGTAVTRRMSRWGSECTDGETLFSLETVETNGALTGSGDVDDDDSFVSLTLNTRTLFIDLHCRTEVGLVELWHPKRLRFLSMMLSVLSVHSVPSGTRLPRASLPPLIGYAISFSAARIALFVTGSDVNPGAERGITRGIAFSSGLSLRYCSVRTEQGHALSAFRTLHQNRTRLTLPVDKHDEFLDRVSEAGGQDVLLGKLMLWNTTLRVAAADEFSMDDPHIIERESPSLENKQILGMKAVTVELAPRVSAKSDGTYGVSFIIEDALLRVEIGSIYSALLALRTLQTLQQCAISSIVQQSRPSVPTHKFTVHGTVKSIRIRLLSLGQNVVARVNYLNLDLTPRGLGCSINSFFVWVPVPQRHLTDETAGETWEELGRLHRCTISLSPTLKAPILLGSDSLRIRIPSGYVFAELQLAVVITLKAIKHLSHVVQSGRFTPFPNPDAESAKHVPDITLTCRMFCLEAEDNSFESQLGFNFKVGLAAAKARLHREEAFDAKAAAVLAGRSAVPDTSVGNTDYQFGQEHSVSIHEARQRLDVAHSLDWMTRLRHHSRERVALEDLVYRELHGAMPLKRPTKTPDLVKTKRVSRVPPLLRVIISGFHLHVQPPTFPPEHLSSFLHEQGNGIPHTTRYSLLIPMHLNITLSSLQVSLRDYPLPLLYIPSRAQDSGSPSLVFDTNLVVAEEMGSLQSVDWIPCPVTGLEESDIENDSFIIHVPKTVMPVKTYARPLVSVLADQTTAFAWGVSYSPAIQDVVRILDSLTPETRDPSPHLGFWDKMRLIFHWTIEVSFREEVRLYLKGSGDPYILDNDGAGFALCWQGEPQLNIGFRNKDRELVQVTSDTMSIIIPKFESVPNIGSIHAQGHLVSRTDCVKTCAKLCSGVRFGVGTLFERTCSSMECSKCTGSPFDRECRFFHFRPHYTVQPQKGDPPELQVDHDSYRGFRSDFIHLSISLTSALRRESSDSKPSPSSFHLTPNAFANFWSWWGLFDNGLSLPIRQGALYPERIPSPKFSRHLATIKYRISVPQLFITHAYIDDTRESWENGTTTVVGLKARVSHFQADMHQRDQETIAPGEVPDSIQVVRHKPFYAAEVVLKDVDLRAILAVFPEPLKQSVSMPINAGDGQESKVASTSDMPSSWLDSDDFVETDWSPPKNLPEIQAFSVLSCPKLTYLKKNTPIAEIHAENSKFGDEDTHTCLLGGEHSVPQVEISLAEKRIAVLRHMAEEEAKSDQIVQRQYPLEKMISLLRDYVNHLKAVDECPEGIRKSNAESYYMPAEMVSANEWADFENVYQVHSPNLFMCDAVRDTLIRYYNCSKARRGYEYHMATRAVKFIRDQAEAMAAQGVDMGGPKSRASVGAAQAAASALRRMLIGGRASTSLDIQSDLTSDITEVNPLDGWDEGVVLRKRHFCLLLKPQIILRSGDPSPDINTVSVVILAAVQAKLQAFKIMDASNLEDPISGNIMRRSYLSLDGVQTFCPAALDVSNIGSVPLEVLLDYRCESNSFDRIVPQTNANCQYDQFNRLRLRSNITSAIPSKPEHLRRGRQAHLQNDTDLVQVHVPRFTVLANDRHFQFLSTIITQLILFSDVAHKSRLEKLETLLFAYDFTDLRSASMVVSDFQSRLRSVIETHNDVRRQEPDNRSQTRLQTLKLKAHIFMLAEELSLIFDAIRLAQSRTDGRADHKSALLLEASSSEISWRMLDDNRELLAKLAVHKIDFSWLNKQDSSTVSSLSVGDMQAFDGSPHAVWTEIVSKYEEPSNHPLAKRDLFLEADWIVLAPVGGITIFEKFQLDLHPIRLQLDARLGRRIMEYVWPTRRARNQAKVQPATHGIPEMHHLAEHALPRSSLDSPRVLHKPRASLDSSRLTPTLRKLGPSRSFTDLRSAAAETPHTHPETTVQPATPDLNVNEDSRGVKKVTREDRAGKDDAVEMKTRSYQKTFILVKISSIELLLSIMKAESFECRDARIRTHPLEIRNQTWSFEELVDQFIPSDLTWRGWVRMAFHQPLVPVFPVARELLSKTKLIPSKNAPQGESRPLSQKKFTLRGKRNPAEMLIKEKTPRSSSSGSSIPSFLPPGNILAGEMFTDEPESLESGPSERDDTNKPRSRTRLLSVFSRGKTEKPGPLYHQTGEYRSSVDSQNNTSSMRDGSTDLTY